MVFGLALMLYSNQTILCLGPHRYLVFVFQAESFTSSMYVKKPSRIEGLIFIMTLSLLIYSIAQRKLRQILKENGDSIPDQSNRQTNKPTLRWVFQLFDGINVIILRVDDKIQRFISGISECTRQIIDYFGGEIANYYDENLYCKLDAQSA